MVMQAFEQSYRKPKAFEEWYKKEIKDVQAKWGIDGEVSPQKAWKAALEWVLDLPVDEYIYDMVHEELNNE